MTDKKISQLPEITTPASADIIPVVDIDANTTKKITAANLSTFINSSFPIETIRDTIGAMLTGNTETDITVTHDDPNDKINFVVSVSASNLPNNIDAAKIADGSVSNTEFQRLDGLTSNIQTQIDTKVSKSGDTMSGTLAMGNNAITTSSTVDGRDVSTDGTKLDGIEAGATADQTNTEIRAAVEAASDSNVFTDADHSKLNAIEASATADQTDAEIRAAVEAASDSNVFTDTDHTKLNGIEASADVTDATNVTAAGALMDSELTNVAAVKGINQALTTTSSPTFAGITGPLTGNASTASTLATARTINLGGEVTGSASFNGGSDITITGTIAANSVGVNELALNDGSNGQFIQTDGAGTITFASAIGSSVINNSAANRITTVNANTTDFDAETNLTFDGSTLALTGNMTASGTIDGVDISARDAVLTSTTTTANAALPKAGGAMTGAITSTGDFTVDVAGDINLDSDSGAWRFKDNGGSIIELSVGAGNSPTFYSANSDADIVFKGNDGGSPITALTLDMSGSGQAVFGSSVFVGNHFYLNDNKKAHFGDSEDLQIYHDGSNSKIETASGSTGDLYIASQRAGSDLYLRAENDVLIQPQGGENGIAVRGDGGVVIYNDNGFKLETDGQGANVSGTLDISSKVVVAGGTDATSSDGAIRTAGGISAAKKAYVGTDLTVDNNIIVAGTVDGVDVASLNTTVGNLATVATSGAYGDLSGTPTIPSAIGGSTGVDFNDNVNVRFGTGNDLVIRHSGNHSFIEDAGAGDLYIRNDNTVHIQNASGTESKALFTSDGAVELFHDGSSRFFTTSTGSEIQINGNADANLKISNNHSGTAARSAIFLDANAGGGQILALNSGYTSSGNYVADSMAFFADTAMSNGMYIGARAADSSVKLIAADALQASVINDGIKLPDNKRVHWGDGKDFSIFHNGSQTILDDSGTGSVELRTNSFGVATAGGLASMISAAEGGAVQLYHNGSSKLQTTSGGITVTGTITASGNITANSDQRLKSDIKTIDNALDKVSQMRGVTYTKDNELGSGVIAQEIEKVAPELVLDGEYKSVAYGNTVGYLIEAIKELKAEIEELKKDK